MDNENHLSIPPKLPTKSALTENIIAQILGLVALALIMLAIGGKYKLLLYAAGCSVVAVSVMKPSLIPYLFILSFFTTKSIFASGRMLNVHVTDAAFLLLIFAFVSNKRLSIRAALEKQRVLLITLTLFALWTVVGYLVNFYFRTTLENLTSLVFIFNFFEMAAAVVVFSQPQWRESRDKFIFFYVVCAFCESVIAVLLEVAGGAKSLSDFSKFPGTLGPHHSMLSNVMVLSFGVASCAFFELRERRAKLFSLLVAALSIATICLSGSRGIVLGMVMALPVILMIRARHAPALFVAAALFGGAAAVLFKGPLINIAMAVFMGSGADGAADMSIYGRILIWERVYEHILYGPWLQKIVGIGVGVFSTLPFSYYLEVGTFTTGAHNNFLNVFVEAGIVGLVIYLAFFTEIVRKLVLGMRRKDYASGCFLLCTLSLLFSCLTQDTFWFSPSFARFGLHYLVFYLMIFNFRNQNQSL